MKKLCKQIPLLLVLLGLLLIILVLSIYRHRIRRLEQKIQKENHINANHEPHENFYMRVNRF